MSFKSVFSATMLWYINIGDIMYTCVLNSESNVIDYTNIDRLMRENRIKQWQAIMPRLSTFQVKYVYMFEYKMHVHNKSWKKCTFQIKIEKSEI